MAQTFYIKSTGFDDSSDSAEREDNSFIIGPGELDGPGGVNRNSDLYLYGFGAIKWGKGVDQNLYRLLENNGVLAKADGDFLPGTDDEGSYIPATPTIPGNGSYLVSSSPILPKSEIDLGAGNGITTPIVGQTWYNETNGELYKCDALAPAIWSLITATTDQELANHIADMDLHLTALQNAFLDGLLLGTDDATELQSDDVNQLIGINPGISGNVQIQLDSMVEKIGDTMTGDLNMSTANIVLDDDSEFLLDAGNSSITTHKGTNDFNIRVGSQWTGAGPDEYHTTGVGAAKIAVAQGSLALAIDPELLISVGQNSSLATAGDPVNYTGNTTFKSNGNVSVNAALPITADDLTRKDYVDNVQLGVSPVGGIIMFFGIISTLPPQWKLCDGQNGTIDLRDKFILGAFNQGEIGTQGGDANSSVISHTHSGPSHRHDKGSYRIQGEFGAGNNQGIGNQGGNHSGPFGPGAGQGDGVKFDGTPDVNVRFDTDIGGWSGFSGFDGTDPTGPATGGVSGTGKNLPPYYKLAYIQRVA